MDHTWLVFYGHQMGMSRQEINGTIYGQMLDLISCLAIYGGAEPEAEEKSMEPLEWMGVQ